MEATKAQKPKKEPKVVEFDDERAEQVFRIITNFWSVVRPHIKLPQERMPLSENASPEEKANFLIILAIFQRGGVISDTPSNGIHRIYARRPDLFDPREVVKMTEAEIYQAIRTETVFNYKIGEFVKSWLVNSKLLVDEFNGSALNLVDADSFREAFDRIDGRLYGIQLKIFSLFVIWLQEQGLVSRFGAVPLPIDFHAARLLMSTGVVKTGNLETPITKEIFGTKTAKEYPQLAKELLGRPSIAVRRWLVDSIAWWSLEKIQEYGYSHLEINPGLWVFSRNFCSKSPQAIVSRNHSLLLDPEDLEKTLDLWGEVKDQGPCELCPLSSLCERIFPSEPNYRFGKLVPVVRLKRSESQRPIISKENPFQSLMPFLTRDGNGELYPEEKRKISDTQIPLLVYDA